MNLTIEHAKKIQKLIRCGIPKGRGKPEPGKMCIEHIICHVIGRDYSDSPTECVLKSGITFKIRLNDSEWGSDQQRAKGMERIGLAQLGSNKLDEVEFTKELQRLTIRIIVPLALRYAKMEKEALILEKNPSIENCRGIRHAANAANAANATYAAAYAADAADAANAAAAAAVAANAADKFKIYWICAELGVKAFRHIGSSGCKWMDELSPMTDEFKELVKDNKILCEELGI